MAGGGGSDDDKKGDRRRTRRVRQRLKLRFWAEGVEGRGFTHDLSLTGMLIETTSAVEIGRRMHVEVELPDQASYFTEVVVVRKKVVPRQAQSMYKPGLGVRMIGLVEALKGATSPRLADAEAAKVLRLDLRERKVLQEVYDRDVKHGALTVETPHLPEVDDVVSVTLQLPEPHGSIEVIGIVVSQAPELPGFGMMIEDIDQVRARLLEILRS
jgi:Tfp pilus assembly protein PilZ